MKKQIYFLLPLLLLVLSAKAQDVTLHIENAEITNDGTDDFYEADIYISSMEGFKLGVGQFYLAYNEDAFGPNVDMNGNIEFLTNDDPLQGEVSILEFEPFPGAPFYILPAVINDNGTTGAISFFWDQGGFGPSFLPENNVTEIPALLATVRFKYEDVTQDPNICFETSIDSFNDQLFLACGDGGLPCGDPDTQIFDFISDCDGATLPVGCAGTTTYTTGGGWDNGTPDSTMEAVIAESYDTSTGNIDACSLTVESGATLVVNGGDYAKVENDITIDGTLNVLHEGSIVQVNDATVVTNNGSISVEKQLSEIENRGFTIGSSPMTAETQSAYGNPIQFRNHITGNFIPNPDVESNYPGAGNFADDNGDNWVAYAGIMNPGEAYLIMPQTTPTIPAPEDYTFMFETGTLNNGLITFTMEYNGTQNGSPNMLGNPYASAIDADVFIAENDAMVEALYFWEHLTAPSTDYEGYNPSNYSMGDISTYSTVMGGNPAANGGAIPNQYIASGQGFGVKALTAGQAEFNNSMRVTDNNNTYRRPDQANLNRIWINVYNDNYGLGSTTLLGFSEGTTDAFGQGADITRLATPVSLYQELETGEQLGIQARKEFTSEAEVPVSFSTQVETLESYRISILELDGIEISEATVYLIDHELKTITDLNERDYVFNAKVGTYNNRFSIVFEKGTLGLETNGLDTVTVYPNPTTNVLYIKAPQTQVTNIEVFDIRGRKVQENSNETDKIDISQLKSAMYFVEITTENGSVTKRVIKE